MHIQFSKHSVDLSTPQVMGVLNVTPDSFFDGGRYYRQGDDISRSLAQAEAMADAGATFIDVGGESTRPGAEPVGIQEEMDRVLPVISAISSRIDVVVSVDTSKPEVMTAAAESGAGLINDVRALQLDGAITAAAQTGLPVCLMHMQGQPGTMQEKPEYDDVVDEVGAFLKERADACLAHGIEASKIILDPGFGFGKSDTHNLTLLKELPKIGADYPVLVGLSRKSILGRLLGRDVSERLAGSLALANFALLGGARILRVHDVAETLDIIKIFQIINNKE